MARSLDYVVLTKPGIAGATLLGYLLEAGVCAVKAVYVESHTGPTKPRSAQAPPGPPVPQRGRARRLLASASLHLQLARVMPRHYAFRLLQAACGVDELRYLRWCERRGPGRLERACGFPLPEELRGRPVLRTWAEVVSEYGLRVETVETFNSPAAVERLRAEAPDVIIGLGTRILRAEVLETARLGALNAHASILPNYRGGCSEFWQLASGEQQTGVTIHWMAPRVDSGAVCRQRQWPIPPGANHRTLRLMSLFYRLEPWREVLSRLAEDDLPGTPQGEAVTPTFRAPTPEQQRDFYCRGISPLAPRK